MSEYDFDPAAPIGFENFNDSASKQAGLESLKVRVRRMGMNQTAYYAGEAIEPGLFSKISVKAVTKNPSKMKQAVALEAITDRQLAIGGAVAVASGGLGYLLYRFWKWIKTKFSDGAVDESDIENNTLKMPTIDEVNSKGAKIAKTVASNEELAAALKPYADHIDKPEYFAIVTAIHSAKRFGMSKNELDGLLRRVANSRLAKGIPEMAVPLLTIRNSIVPIYKIEKYGKFNKDFVRQLTHYAEDLADQVVLLAATDGNKRDIDKLRSAVKRLDSAVSASPNIQDAINAFNPESELGKVLHVIRTSRIGYFTANSDKHVLNPDDEYAFFEAAKKDTLFDGVEAEAQEFNRTIASINQKLSREGIKESEIARFNSLPSSDRKDLSEISKAIQTHTGNVLRAKKFFQYCYRQVGLFKHQVNGALK